MRAVDRRHAHCAGRGVSSRALRSTLLWGLLIAGALTTTWAAVSAAGARFRTDDPLSREPNSQDASAVQRWTIDLFIDLATNLFGQPGDPATGVHAQDANTIDEVPDSSWFTNRILARSVSIEEAVRGPQAGNGPAPGKYTVTAAKEVGASAGFTMRDQAGETWFVSFDADGYPEAATGAILVANKIFWTLGYWQVDNVITHISPDQILVGDSATFDPMSGVRRPMKREDLDGVWRRANRSPDGTYRAVAAREVPGRTLGGFRYYGTRPDDPNDVVPHEHRRTLRALQVFGAWTNLVDMKAGNTLDTLVMENGRGVVRHYLQDVGSTFGTGGNVPRDYDEGWEHLLEPDLVWKRLVTMNFIIKPWQTVPYQELQGVGRFEGEAFDPKTWKTRVPVAAIRHAQPDDLFWAARRVAAFSDDLIRAVSKTGEYGDPAAEKLLADVLIQRRNKIAAAYLADVNPLVGFAMQPDGAVTFTNAAVAANVAKEPAGGYRVAWARFDNATDAATPIGESTGASGLRPPQALPTTAGTFVRVSVTSVSPEHPSWSAPIHAYFRRSATGWTLVGLERSHS
jgi:hypothetical protein